MCDRGTPDPRESSIVNRYVLFYESADDVMSRAPAVYPAHLARLKEYKTRSQLLMVGTFADPQADGSMAIFDSHRRGRILRHR